MSTLNVDALVGVSSANAITVRGEGSATTSLQQGLLKHFATIQGTDTFATIDSFNQSSATDNGTGNYTATYTTNMDEARVPRIVYTHNTANEGSSELVSKLTGGTHSSGTGDTAPTTSAFRFRVLFGSTASANGDDCDLSYLYMMTSGGLS